MYENYPFWFTVLHQAGLPRGALRPVHEEDLRGRHRVHALRERVLPGQAQPRPHHEPAGQAPGLHLDALHQAGSARRTRGPATTSTAPSWQSYPRPCALNVDELGEVPRSSFLTRVIPYDKKSELKRRLYELISEQREKDAAEGAVRACAHITRAEIDAAVDAAWAG